MTDKAVSAMQVDPSLVRQLAELLDDTRLTEIEVQDGDRRIRVVRNIPVAAPATGMTFANMAEPMTAAAATPTSVQSAALPSPQAAAPAADDPGAVKSPMVGTAYLSAEPGGAAFIQAGKTVAAGDTLLIVEAMKVMNPIVSPRAGTVRTILVDNGQPVEFDQPLVIVD